MTSRQLVIAALVVAAASGVAHAQVGPSSFFFELDGDQGSYMADVTDEDPPYLDPTYEVFEYGPTGPRSWGRRQTTSCGNWSYGPYEPYLGHDSFRMQCTACTSCDQRRTEQMILNEWYAGGTDTTRYFSLAFRLTTLPAMPPAGVEKRGYIAQFHHDGGNPPPLQLSWKMRDGELFLESGVRGQKLEGFAIVDEYTALIGPLAGVDVPLETDVWYRVLVAVTLGSLTNGDDCPIYTDDSPGQVRIWLMDNATGQWQELANELAPVGYLVDVETREPVTSCSFQWKVGIYANDEDPITMYLDNIAYGKRWSNITKNGLVGYHQAVLRLPLDGNTLDSSDYDNDATSHGTPQWLGSTSCVDGTGCVRFSGDDYLRVPMTDDLDVGNYVTVSAWVNPSAANDTNNRGIVMLDEYSTSWRIRLYMSSNFLSFGVRHPDESHASANHTFANNLYVYDGWHHVVGTYNRFGASDHGVLRLYVDGVLVEEVATARLPIARGQNHLVVGKFSTSNFFKGDLDQVGVYNHAWTAADVLAHYEGTLSPSIARETADEVADDEVGCSAGGGGAPIGVLAAATLALRRRRRRQ